MQIQVNSGNSVDVDNELTEQVRAQVENRLGRFDERLTRLEVHLNDENSHKNGAQDKTCQIEARPRGLDPVSANHSAPTVDEAVRGATHKLERLLDSTFGRLADRR
jgi:ribosomal subunit interface protein